MFAKSGALQTENGAACGGSALWFCLLRRPSLYHGKVMILIARSVYVSIATMIATFRDLRMKQVVVATGNLFEVKTILYALSIWYRALFGISLTKTLYSRFKLKIDSYSPHLWFCSTQYRLGHGHLQRHYLQHSLSVIDNYLLRSFL